MNEMIKKAGKTALESVIDYGNGANLGMGAICVYIGITSKDKKLTFCGITMMTAAGYGICKRFQDIIKGGEQ